LSILITNLDKQSISSPDGVFLSNEKGTIQLVSPETEWYVIVPDYDATMRFLPTVLPDEFRKDGLRVLFSEKVGEVPSDARLVGTPFELTEIRKLD
jgi:hypothetical protein